MDSLYGGKQGTSFVIKGRFKYISPESPAYQRAAAAGATEEELAPHTMTVCFSNVNYKKIWYNEYCIINTPNNSDPDNGKVFRRTLKGAGDTPAEGGYAEYIGQIVGPAGQAPVIDIGSLTKVEQDFDNQPVDANDYLKYYNEQGAIAYDKDADSNLYVFTSADGNAIQYIPGNTQDGEGHYIDRLKYNWYEFISAYDTSDSPAIVHIGFEIPYYMSTFEHGRALNFIEDPNVYEHSSTIGDKAPFYDRYVLDVPRGITGGHYGEIQRYTKLENVDVYSTESIIYIPEEDAYTIDTDDTIEVTTGAEIWVGYFTYYRPDGTDVTLDGPIYLGHTKDVTNISLAADGTLTIEYSNTDSDNWELNWLDDVKIEDYHLIIETNNDNIEDIDYDLHIITDITIDNDGTVTITYSDESTDVFDNQLRWITNVEIDENSNLIIETNNEDIDDIEFNLRTIDNVSLAGGVMSVVTPADHRIHIDYSDGTSQIIGDNINYIQDIYVSEPGGNNKGLDENHEGYHLFILFNAKSHIDVPQSDIRWVDINDDGLMWFDTGYLRRIDQGVIAQTRVILDPDTAFADVPARLKTMYPNGLEGSAAGKLVAAQVDEDVYLMAYDYDNEEWFNIGTLSSSLKDAIIDGTMYTADTTAVHLVPRPGFLPSPPTMSAPWGAMGPLPGIPDKFIHFDTIGYAQTYDMIEDIWARRNQQSEATDESVIADMDEIWAPEE